MYSSHFAAVTACVPAGYPPKRSAPQAVESTTRSASAPQPSQTGSERASGRRSNDASAVTTIAPAATSERSAFSDPTCNDGW